MSDTWGIYACPFPSASRIVSRTVIHLIHKTSPDNGNTLFSFRREWMGMEDPQLLGDAFCLCLDRTGRRRENDLTRRVFFHPILSWAQAWRGKIQPNDSSWSCLKWEITGISIQQSAYHINQSSLSCLLCSAYPIQLIGVADLVGRRLWQKFHFEWN